MPQVFQGMRTDTTVALSSVERESSRDSYPWRVYSSLNMLLERMMEMYWSPVIRFMAMPLNTVEQTRPRRVFMKRRNTASRKLFSMPHDVMAPPNTMAERISQMVSIIPPIPLVETRSFRSALPVSTDVELAKVVIMPRSSASKENEPSAEPPICMSMFP